MQLREKKDLMSTPLHNANVLDKPPPIGNPTEEGFGAARISLIDHKSLFLLWVYDVQSEHIFKWIVVAVVVK